MKRYRIKTLALLLCLGTASCTRDIPVSDITATTVYEPLTYDGTAVPLGHQPYDETDPEAEQQYWRRINADRARLITLSSNEDLARLAENSNLGRRHLYAEVITCDSPEIRHNTYYRRALKMREDSRGRTTYFTQLPMPLRGAMVESIVFYFPGYAKRVRSSSADELCLYVVGRDKEDRVAMMGYLGRLSELGVELD